MKIMSTGKEKDCLIVSVEGRMDAVSTPEFEQVLGGWIDDGETRFIVDFAGLDLRIAGICCSHHLRYFLFFICALRL